MDIYEIMWKYTQEVSKWAKSSAWFYSLGISQNVLSHLFKDFQLFPVFWRYIHGCIWIWKSVEIHTGSLQVSKNHPHDFALGEPSNMYFLIFSMIYNDFLCFGNICMDMYENMWKYTQAVSKWARSSAWFLSLGIFQYIFCHTFNDFQWFPMFWRCMHGYVWKSVELKHRKCPSEQKSSAWFCSLGILQCLFSHTFNDFQWFWLISYVLAIYTGIYIY